jgi:essential nuclear protein 1
MKTGCSLKEAAIIASVLSKKKLPMLHSSAALMRLAEMDYSGPNSLFIRVLVDKKYALPYKVTHMPPHEPFFFCIFSHQHESS